MATYLILRERNTVYAIYVHNRKKFKVSTTVRVSDEHWNNEKKCIRKSHPLHQQVQGLIDLRLNELMAAASKVIADGKEPNIDRVRRAYYEQDTPEHAQSTSDIFLKYLELRGSSLSKGSRVNLENCRKLVREFEKEARIDVMKEWNSRNFDRFINFCVIHKTYGDSTVEKYVKLFKRVLHWAYPNWSLSYMRYSWKKGDDIVFLYEEELMQLIGKVYPNDRHSKVRDVFVFMCTTGMRISDIQRFTPEWVSEGVVSYNQQKTKGLATPPMKNISDHLLRMYKGKLPVITGQKFNDYLKEAFKIAGLVRAVPVTQYKGKHMYQELVPLCQVASSHMARRTFISLSLMKGIPIQDVMKMSGHHDYRSMKPYLAVTKEHLKEQSRKWEL